MREGCFENIIRETMMIPYFPYLFEFQCEFTLSSLLICTNLINRHPVDFILNIEQDYIWVDQ